MQKVYFRKKSHKNWIIAAIIFITGTFSCTYADSVKVQSRELPVETDGFWSAVTAASDGKVYIGTCCHGCTAHLLQYDPKTDKIRDLGDMGEATNEKYLAREPQAKIHTKICEGDDGRIYFGTHFGNWWNHTRQIDSKSFPGGHWLAYDPKNDEIKDFGIAAAQQGIITMAMDKKRGRLYGLTFPRGHFIIYDIASDKMIDKGRVCNWNGVSRTMVVDCMGNVYGSYELNRIFKYDVEADELIDLSIEIPRVDNIVPENRETTTSYDVWRVAITSEDGRKIYGIHGGSVTLFEYDTFVGKEGTIKNLGQICADSDVGKTKLPYATLALTMGKDGNLYYAADSTDEKGEEDAHLIRYDLKNYQKTDMGSIRAEKNQKTMYFQGATTAEDGTIYFVGYVSCVHDKPRLIIYQPKK